MAILALDTALDTCSVAVMADDGRILATRASSDRRSGAEILMPMIEEARRAGGVGYSDLVLIAVTVGPGSFTGIRVGLAAARGLALASGRPAVGFTTLAVLAAAAIANVNDGPILSAIDARRGEIYHQSFLCAAGRLVARAEWHPKLSPIEVIASTIGNDVVVVGSGAAILGPSCPTAKCLPSATYDATNLAWLALRAKAGEFISLPPRPLYLRAADARLPSA